MLYAGPFCDGTRRYGVPENENEECIFCMLSVVLSYYYIVFIYLLYYHGNPPHFLKKKIKKVKGHGLLG